MSSTPFASVPLGIRESEPNVNLLAAEEPYVNTVSESFTFRSTTYNAKFVPLKPFDKGTLYTQDPNEEEEDDLGVYELSFPQLYAKGYSSYMQHLHHYDEVNFLFPPAPPDFDSNCVKNSDMVSEYVRGLATAYDSIHEKPAPFDMYRHVIMETALNFINNAAASHEITGATSNAEEDAASNLNNNYTSTNVSDIIENSNSNIANDLNDARIEVSNAAAYPVSRNTTWAAEGAAWQDSLRDPMMSSGFDIAGAIAAMNPFMDSQEISISISLTCIKALELKTIQVLFRKLLTSPEVCSLLPSDVVETALLAFDECLKSSRSVDVKRSLCSLLGIVVSGRGRVEEVLRYLKILEGFNKIPTASDVPTIMPQAKEILDTFTLDRLAHLPLVSPIDCYQEDLAKLKKITLKEGTSVRCFCVSPDLNYLAVSALDGLVLYDFQKGSLIPNRDNPSEGKCFWNMTFSSDSQYIIGTEEQGTSHIVVPVTLAGVAEEVSTQEVNIALDYCNGVLKSIPPPYLPYGNASSLYLFQKSDSYLFKVKDVNHDKVSSFSVCGHIHKDFYGTLVNFQSENESLIVVINQDVVSLHQGSSVCYGVVPTNSPWLFLHVKWVKGAWSLSINFSAVELRGTRYGSSKEVSLLSASCVWGMGHIGSLAAWVDTGDARSAQSYFASKQIGHQAAALFNFQFDEGEGMWVKEMVSRTCHELPETYFVWDAKITAPYSAASSKPSVRLSGRYMLQGRVLSSALRVYLIFPSEQKGSDDIVAEVNRDTNVIIRVYPCPHACSENLYSILNDESELFVYHQRFSAFSRARIYTKLYKERELAVNGFKDCDNANESIGWFLHEMYKKIHVEGTELLRVPWEDSRYHRHRLTMLTDLIGTIRVDTPKMKVLSLLSLTYVLFASMTSTEEAYISHIAQSLKTSCAAVKENFEGEKMIQESASELLNLATLRSLPLEEKANILLHLDVPENAYLLKKYISKDTLPAVIGHIVANKPEKMGEVARMILETAHRETTNGEGDRATIDLIFWFVICSVNALRVSGKDAAIGEILEIFMRFTNNTLDLSANHENTQCSVFHAGLIPLLIVVAEKCPSVVTPVVEEHLLELTRKIREAITEESKPELVSFVTSEACDVYPSGRDTSSQVWRFLMDFKEATSVSVLKESSKSFKVLYEDKSEQDIRTTVMDSDVNFLKINNGSQLVFFGEGEITFTTVVQYDFMLNISWVNLLRCAVRHLLIQYCFHLTEHPRDNGIGLMPLLRNGLTDNVLAKHGVCLVRDENITAPNEEEAPPTAEETEKRKSLALEILEDVDEGKACVDQVFQRMHNSIIPSMRSAVQCILAIMVHCGCTAEQAEDELKVRWFSGEWGSKLQSSSRDRTKSVLLELAKWITSSIRTDPDIADTPHVSFADRRGEVSFNSSQRSNAERRSSTAFPPRRSIVKNTFPFDALEQIRILVSRESLSKDQIEKMLVERTQYAIRIERGLALLSKLIEIDKDASDAETSFRNLISSVLGVLWRFSSVETGQHYTDSLGGCGVELEADVRVAFHSLLQKCRNFLFGTPPRDVQPQFVLKSTPKNGTLAMILLAILCHPWDSRDCEMINDTWNEDGDLLNHLEGQLNVPIGNLTLTNPWRLRRDDDLLDVTNAEEELVKAEYVGAADINSISRLFPNDFSFIVPQIQTSRSAEGIGIQKNSATEVLLRADEGWPLMWREGLPRVFYFETKIIEIKGKLVIGLHSDKMNNPHNFFFDSTGGTHSNEFPTFGEGDCVGCGLISATRQVFFTLNGKFLFTVGVVLSKFEFMYPALRFDDVTGYHVCVNFGTTAFNYDFRQLHPAMNLKHGPSWYRVASTAEIVLHYITSCACQAIQDSRRATRQFLTNCSEVVCRNVNKVTSSLMNLGVGAEGDARTRIKQAVIFSVAGYSIMVLTSTMRRVMSCSTNLPESVSDMIFDATSVLMLLPLHSIQISTISLLPVIIPHVHEVRDKSTFSNLVRTLFEHAKESGNSGLIPFKPFWCSCDSQYMSILNAQTARMLPGAQRSIVLGNILPRTGVVSFAVKIRRGSLSRAHSLKGGYFIGVSIAGLSPLSPTSNSHSWKAVKPPIVWALHDTSPQLSHATNPTVKPNNFQRTFGNGDIIRVVVNRDTRCIDFYRGDQFLKTLFNDIPADVDLVPFVQLYNEDAGAVIMAGEMTAPITTPTLLSAASVDVLRSMLTLEPFQDLVSAHLCQELETEQHPKVTLALFNSVPDPRVLELRNTSGEKQFVTVSRITGNRCKFSIGDEVNFEHTYNLRTPAKAKITCFFDTHLTAVALNGLSKCIERLVGAAQHLVMPLITMKALNCREMANRQQILDDEKDHWDFLLHGSRCSLYVSSLKAENIYKPPVSAPLVPIDYTFSAALSHPSVFLSPQYCGRLATVPTQSKNTTAPFIAIAEPSIPLEGKYSIRCRLIRGHNGQILGGGYYFGVCAKSFTWERKELHNTVPDVWAIHDMDDSPWRLRHLHPSVTFTITAEPRCIIVSGDIIRLEITRNGDQPGTMHAFRKPANGDEIPLGLLYDNLPACELYPFVNLYNTEAVAVLLGSNSDEPALRLPMQQPNLAISQPKDKRFCDGCIAQHNESRLSTPWYKCNECADYSLCPNCFSLCIHSYHSFTLVGESKTLAHSNYPPTRIEPKMEVVIPGTNCTYLKSAGCKRTNKFMSCVVKSYTENALAVWGMVHNDTRCQFTAVITTTTGEPLSSDSPVFVGISTSEDVICCSREKMRENCFAMAPHLIAFCSDPNLRCKLENPSRYPHGFQSGSRITFDVDIEKRTVTIIRDWIVVGTRTLEFKNNDTLHPIFCFISFGKKKVQASILPEVNTALPAVIEEQVSPRLVKVRLQDNSCRFITTESCRLPLHPCTEVYPTEPFTNLLGYTFVNKKMVQASGTVTTNYPEQVTIQLLNEDIPKIVPSYTFLVDRYNAIEEVTILNKDSNDVSATMEEGFVISRLLLILSCLCENSVLAPLVMENTERLLDMIKGLSSVEISNENPLYFIKEIRDSVAITAHCMRSQNFALKLNPFVPTYSQDERRRSHKPDMLVCGIEDEKSGNIYRILSRKGEILRLQDINSQEKVEMRYVSALPIKQSGGKPWTMVPDGLPSTLLEHTIRLSEPSKANVKLTPTGEWEGEIELSKNLNQTCEISFLTPHFGKAKIAGEVYGLIFNHWRYERRLRFCFFQLQKLESSVRDLVCSTPMEELIVFEEVIGKLQITKHFIVDAELDAEGFRMQGNCRQPEGQLGSFWCISTKRISLISPSTDILNIEPLPSFQEVFPATPPQYLIADSMHRLIVLLARHLHLVISNQMRRASKEVIEQVSLYATHPLADRLISEHVELEQLLFMIARCTMEILDTAVKPWDAATLAQLLTKNFLLRPDVSSKAPPSLVWDALHAVVAAAHKCGRTSRQNIIRDITTFVENYQNNDPALYVQLFSPMVMYIGDNVTSSSLFAKTNKDISAGVELILTLKDPLQKSVPEIPLAPLLCLIDLWRSLRDAVPLPNVIQTAYDSIPKREAEVEAMCTFGELENGLLKVGKIMSSCATKSTGKFYYEVTLPERSNAPFAVGWGTTQHSDVPSQHVGCDRFSFSFNGSDIATRDFKTEYKIAVETGPSSVIGCLLDVDSNEACWSVNGIMGPLIPIPVAFTQPLYAFASIGASAGMRIRLKAEQFEYAPDNYTDLSGHSSRLLMDTYDANERSKLPVKPLRFFTQLASYLSDLESYRKKSENDRPGSSISTSNPASILMDPIAKFIPRYSALQGITEAELDEYAQVVAVVESCMATATRFVDLDGPVTKGSLSLAFMYLKSLVRSSFREKLLFNIPPLEKAVNPITVSVHVTELYSTLPRTPEVALSHTILAQLYRQMSNFKDSQWSAAPLFKANYHANTSTHVPIDMGGPYRQVWSALGDELMQHPDKCYPNSNFHRNPLFVFVNNSHRVSLVPDGLATSSFELALFNFFGKLLGHAVRAKIPLNMDFSPFIWRFLIDDTLNIRDYYQYVDSVVEKSIEDDTFLLSEVAEEIIPNFQEKIAWINDEELGPEKAAEIRRQVAENCLVHSMDEQLKAIRDGMWSVIPRRVLRCSSWQDLEKLACGTGDLSINTLKRYIVISLQPIREKFFWQIVETLTNDQRSSLLCFASGQRRVPLFSPITVMENNESVDHLPRAQSCSYLISVPPYTSYETFRDKLLLALQHTMEMELA